MIKASLSIPRLLDKYTTFNTQYLQLLTFKCLTAFSDTNIFFSRSFTIFSNVQTLFSSLEFFCFNILFFLLGVITSFLLD